MSIVIISGSGGLIGSEAALYFGELGFHIVGIDNDMRRYYFGDKGSTAWNNRHIARALGKGYRHHELDIRNREQLLALMSRYQKGLFGISSGNHHLSNQYDIRIIDKTCPE